MKIGEFVSRNQERITASVAALAFAGAAVVTGVDGVRYGMERVAHDATVSTGAYAASKLGMLQAVEGAFAASAAAQLDEIVLHA